MTDIDKRFQICDCSHGGYWYNGHSNALSGRDWFATYDEAVAAKRDDLIRIDRDIDRLEKLRNTLVNAWDSQATNK